MDAERYYIMTKAQFEAAIAAAIAYSDSSTEENASALHQTESACLAREVFPVPAHEGISCWVELKDKDKGNGQS